MTIFHPFVDKPTIDFVERSPNLKKLLIELNHRYGIVACTKAHHNSEESVSLVWPNLVFVGFASVVDDMDTDTREIKSMFCIESALVEKERGRGRNRFVRKSEKLAHLIKIVDKKFKERVKSFANQPELRITGARSSVFSMIETKTARRAFMTHLNGDEEYALLKNCIMDEPMSQYLREKITDSLIKHQEREKENLEREKNFRKFDHVHMLWGSSTTPVCYGVAQLVAKEYVIQGEIKPCFDERDLPDDFAVLLKMHKIGKEHIFKDNEVAGFTPMHSNLLRKDMYDQDFDVVTYYAVSDAHRGTKYLYVTPVQSTDAN